jgi:hypothetical protein
MTIQTKELKEITINEHVYKGKYLPASKGISIAFKLAEIMGVAYDDTKTINPNNIGNIIKIIESGDENLMLKILACSTRDNEAINKDSFDRFYANNYRELIDILLFVAEENFGDFFQGNGTGLLDVLNQKVTAKV